MNDAPARTRMPSGTKRRGATGRGASSAIATLWIGKRGDASASPSIQRELDWAEKRAPTPTLPRLRGRELFGVTAFSQLILPRKRGREGWRLWAARAGMFRAIP